MRLNGLVWLGILLSVAWVIGAAIHIHNADVEGAENFASFAYKVCSDGKSLAHDNDLSSCEQERKKNLEIWMEGTAGNVAFAALAPIPLGWLAAFVLVYAGRAQIVGFRAVVPWTTLTWYGKSAVVISVLASLAALLFSIVVVLNLYVDTKVPVALAQRAMISKTEDLVVAVGTWTRSGRTEESSVSYPLQTSRIECDRQSHRCTESRAFVSGNVLMSDLVDYDVDSWTDAAIVFKNEGLCGTEVFTIDLKTEAVSGAGHSINKDSAGCKMFPGSEESWKYQLTDGFKIYWELRQRARPLPLRLIQTFFGN